MEGALFQTENSRGVELGYFALLRNDGCIKQLRLALFYLALLFFVIVGEAGVSRELHER